MYLCSTDQRLKPALQATTENCDFRKTDFCQDRKQKLSSDASLSNPAPNSSYIFIFLSSKDEPTGLL